MTSFRIGGEEFELQILGSGVRHGSLPRYEPGEANWDLTLKESRDLEAFEAAGWRFQPKGELDWDGVFAVNRGARFEIGVLVRRNPWGGLAIVRDRLVITVQPGVQWVPQVPDFAAVRPVPLTDSSFDAQIHLSDAGILATLKERIVSLNAAFQEGVIAEPLLVEHYVNSGHMVGVLPPPTRMDILQWHWNKISLARAWCLGSKGAQTTGGNRATRVAVIDFGFDLSEPQILGQYVSWAYVDDAGNVCPNGPMPNWPHGTLCAGIVGAKLDGLSVNGAAPEAKLILIAVQSVTTQLALSTALRLCINGPNQNDGADVISGSIGTNTNPTTFPYNLQGAVNDVATKGRGYLGTPILWADFNTDDPILPGSFESSSDLLCIGQSDKRDQRLSCGIGFDLDLIAPGDAVWGLNSTLGKPSPAFGSSVAAPMVAAVAALVLSHRPDLICNQVVFALTGSCDLAYNQTTRPDDRNGWGRLNAEAAINKAMTL